MNRKRVVLTGKPGLFGYQKDPLLECKIEIMVFLWNYLYKTGVVLRRGKCRGCGVGSDGSRMAALPIVRHWQGWLGLLHRLDAVARSVLLASVDVQRRQESRCTEQDKMLSFVLSWRVVRSGCCNVPQMGGSPALFRCAKIGFFGEHGVAGRGKYGCGGGGNVGFRGSRGIRCSRGNPF